MPGPNFSQPSATLYDPLVMNVRIAVESRTQVRFHPSASRAIVRLRLGANDAPDLVDVGVLREER